MIVFSQVSVVDWTKGRIYWPEKSYEKKRKILNHSLSGGHVANPVGWREAIYSKIRSRKFCWNAEVNVISERIVSINQITNPVKF